MLSRLIPKHSHFRLLTLISSKSQSYPHSIHDPIFPSIFRSLSTNHNNNNNNNNNNRDQSTSNTWNLSRENDEKFDLFFNDDSRNITGITGSDSPAGEPTPVDNLWLNSKDGSDDGDIFKGIDKEVSAKSDVGREDEWLTAEGYKAWNLVEEEKDDVFDIGEAPQEVSETRGETSSSVDSERSEEDKRIEREEKELTAVLKGPNRAFGDLMSASGITDAMLDSLIALKDLEGIDGLPLLSEIEDMRYEKNTKKSTRAEIERQKQEEVAKARVRQVDDKGRAYGTGRRKCSVARVWVQPGDGKFIINDKEFDAYFPLLDHRAALLRPFSETKTLGLWDVSCTVKGGGTTGQVGAIQLGISRALQNWEPDLRPPLRAVGFLTRDSRVVERKKPGKAKARKSFQWVKR